MDPFPNKVRRNGSWSVILVLAIMATIAWVGIVRPTLRETSAASGDLIILWEGATSTIPSGWTCASCLPGEVANGTSTFMNVFPMASSGFAFATSGVDSVTHTLTFSVSSTIGSIGVNNSTAGKVIDRAVHGHTWATPTVNSESIIPPYKALIFIKATNPTTIPLGAIAMFDVASSSLPTDWSYYSAMENVYLRGSDVTSTGGSATVAPTITGAITSGNATSGLAQTTSGTTINTAAASHNHTIPATSTLDVQANTPSYISVVFGKAAATTTLADGMLAFFDTAVPSGWTTLSTSGGIWGNRLIVGSSTFGNTGGVTTGDHGGSVTWTSTAANGTAVTDRTGSAAQAATPTSAHTVTYTVDSKTAIPVSRPIIVAKKLAPTFSQNIYRWFTNQDSADVGAALATNNTVAVQPASGGPVRLRMLLAVTTSAALSGGNIFKLQYALRGSDNACDTAFSGESYTDVADLRGSIWAQATSSAAWSGRYDLGVLAYNNQMWVVGGHQSSIYQNDVWSSTDGITWTQATSSAAWQGRAQMGAVAYNNKMWVMGGVSSTSAFYNDVWSSSDGITWTQATSNANWSTRTGLGALAYNNQMWVMGGYNGSYVNDVWSSSDGITWTQATAGAGWAGRQLMGAVVYNNKMWVMGGTGGVIGGEHNDVWSSTDGATWTRATSSAAWQCRDDFGVVAYNNKMWVFGGRINATAGCVGSGTGKDVWSSTDGITWTQATSSAAWSTRSGLAALAYTNRMWVMGSNSGGGGNDVWVSPSVNPSVAFYDNPSVADDSALIANANDPTDGTNATVNETYQESNPFSNSQSSIAMGQDGMWDFSLAIAATSSVSNYCFRAVQSDGSLLSTYNTIPQITTPTPALSQAKYRWFTNIDSGDVGAALAASNTAASVTGAGTPFRLRMLLHANADTAANGSTFKLQAAVRGADNTCDTAFSGENYQDIDGGSGNTWIQATSSAAWSIRNSMSSLVYNSKMWVMGGQASGYYNDVWSSADGITWTRATAGAGWSARNGQSSLVFNNKMWVMGGQVSAPTYSASDVWDSTDGITWNQDTGSAGWGGRDRMGAVVYNSKMWVMGGEFSLGFPPTVYGDTWSSSDGATWTQATTTSSWSSRASMTTLVYNSKMWLMGGGQSGGQVFGDVWYSTDGATWTQATSSAAWGPREYMTGMVYNNKMWVMGGYDGSSYRNDVWSSTDGITWTQATSSAQWSIRGLFSGAVFNNYLWVFGGGGGGVNKNDVWYSGSTSTIHFYDNPTPTDGSALTANANDPTDGSFTTIGQTYDESNPFSNSLSTISSGQDGEWDFSLYIDPSDTTNTYCFRAVNSDGSLLSSYSVIPEIGPSQVSCSTDISSASLGALSSTAITTTSGANNASTTMTCGDALGCTLQVSDAGNGSSPGLATTSPAYLIPSNTGVLSVGVEGYGIQATTTSVGSGTITLSTIYNKVGNDVGGLSLTGVTLASSTGAFTGREVTVTHLASVSPSTQTGTYTDTITYSCVGN